MSSDNKDLVVGLLESFDSWRGKYNILTERTKSIQTVGDVGALDPAIPVESRDNVVEALNYVYSIRVSEGQPLTDSVLTNCLVPFNSNLFFGKSDQFSIKNNGNMQISYAGTPRITVDTIGRVGIATASPESTLHVNGDMQSNELKIFNPASGKGLTVSNISIGSVNYTVVNTDTNLIFNSSSSPTIINRGGGKVGIGYDSIADFDANASTLNIRSATPTSGLTIETISDKFEARMGDGGSIGFYQNAALSMAFSSDYNVGIGVPNPEYKLHINGSQFATSVGFASKLYAGSNEIADVSVGGAVTFTIPTSGSLKYAANTIIDTDGKVVGSTVKGLTTSNVTEGTNLYFTNSRAVAAVSEGKLPSVLISNTGTLAHGITTIVGTDSKISTSVVKFDTPITLDNILNLKPYESVSRPTDGIIAGTVIYDSTLSLPIFYDGTDWKKFDGTAA